MVDSRPFPVTPARDKIRSIRLRSCFFAAVSALSVSPGVVGDAQAAPLALTLTAPAEEVLRLQVEMSTDRAGDEGEAIESRLSTAIEGVFVEQSVLKGDSSAPSLKVAVAPYEDAENPGYDATLSVIADGAEVEGSSRVVACALCTHGELAEKVSTEAAALIGAIRSGELVVYPPEPEPEIVDGEADVLPEGPEPETGPDPSVEPRKKLGTLGFTGIGMMGVGAIGAGVGAAIVGRDDEVVENDDSLKKFKTPGAILLSVGAAAIVSGAVLLVVDRRKAKQAAK
jgi:hypothetical protein